MRITIRPIEAEDDPAIASIIQQVGREFGAIGEGFGPSDEEVTAMSEHYHPAQRSQYWTATLDGEIVGGGGIASFSHSEQCCELRKLFLLPSARGHGIGRRLAETALNQARLFGYQECYLDTLGNMDSAISLYLKLGFVHLEHPLQGTEHNGCDVWMLKQL